jgi:anti-anti-sigma regulatory factor
MSKTELRFETDGFAIEVTRSEAEATITWTGESDSRNPGEFLAPITTRLTKELRGLKVTIDFSALKYMNSATVAPLIVCIKSLDGAASSVRVVFSDADWQRTHVQCMRTIARTLSKVTVEVGAVPSMFNRVGHG